MNPDEKKNLLRTVRRYLAEHYAPPASPPIPFLPFYLGAASAVPSSFRDILQKDNLSSAEKSTLFRSIRQMLQPGFRELLFDMIQKKGIDHVELYQRSDITKAHFSKMKNDENYHPSKETVLALALGMKLTLSETKNLLERAGYTLTNSSPTDVVITCFIEIERYDVHAVNEILDTMGLPTLTNHKRSRSI